VALKGLMPVQPVHGVVLMTAVATSAVAKALVNRPAHVGLTTVLRAAHAKCSNQVARPLTKPHALPPLANRLAVLMPKSARPSHVHPAKSLHT
jgi:hypothetical protein